MDSQHLVKLCGVQGGSWSESSKRAAASHSKTERYSPTKAESYSQEFFSKCIDFHIFNAKSELSLPCRGVFWGQVSLRDQLRAIGLRLNLFSKGMWQSEKDFSEGNEHSSTDSTDSFWPQAGHSTVTWIQSSCRNLIFQDKMDWHCKKFLDFLRYLRSDRWHTVTITSDCQDRTVPLTTSHCSIELILFVASSCEVLVFLDGMQATEKEINIGAYLGDKRHPLYWNVFNENCFCKTWILQGTTSAGLGADDAGRRVQGPLAVSGVRRWI